MPESAAAAMSSDRPLVLAVPKGRILKELVPLLERAGIRPEEAFFDKDARQLRFSTNVAGLDLIRVRAFDVPTFVAHGAAQLGVSGNDVVMEFDYPAIYAPVDLKIGYCRLAVAEPRNLADQDDPKGWRHVRVATKFPGIAKRHFRARGVTAECIKLNGAMELAPNLGLSRHILDLVSTGSTLRANDLVEVEQVAEVTSRLIVNRSALKLDRPALEPWIARFREAVDAA
jgi:ATP phosphoribosyltransferase